MMAFGHCTAVGRQPNEKLKQIKIKKKENAGADALIVIYVKGFRHGLHMLARSIET